jgi:anti-anti-sigma factor
VRADAPAADQPVVVDLDGDIDVARAAPLGDRLCALIETGPPAISVVCSSVTFIESRGLAMMARVQRFADEAGCRLAWRGLPLHALRTIHLTGLDTYLVIEA